MRSVIIEHGMVNYIFEEFTKDDKKYCIAHTYYQNPNYLPEYYSLYQIVKGGKLAFISNLPIHKYTQELESVLNRLKTRIWLSKKETI